MDSNERQLEIVQLLRSALEGDASAMDKLRTASQPELLTAGQTLGGRLTFGRPTILRVLTEWRSGRVRTHQVQSWALLMFMGEPLDIDYSADEAVNEAVFRLKDLGEVVDGLITGRERDAMISELEESE